MFNLNLRYIFFISCTFAFGILFFTVGFYLPHIKKWKSNKLLHLSKVYQDESISNESNLLADGVRKARIANLLDPSNLETRENFIELLFRANPTEALQKWARIFSVEQVSEEKTTTLLKRSIKTLKDDSLEIYEKRIAGEIAIGQLNFLLTIKDWLESPDNTLIAAELLAETGNPVRAIEIVKKSLENHPTHAESIFLLTRLSVHLSDNKSLPYIAKKLADLSNRKSISGVEAIRHLTLLHLLNPLSKKSLRTCIELLQSNPHAEPIDFMRIHALQYHVSAKETEKISVVKLCSEQFDLEQNKELLVFSSWLGRLGAYQQLLQYLSASRAKVEEELFKLRMNALAQTNDLDSIHFEVNNAPIIPERWRLVIEARAYSLEGNYKESIKVLNRLLPVLGNDPRLVRSICNYLESSEDITGLAHILNKLIDQPIHQSFALRKLMQHRASSATLEELLGWMSKLSKLHGNDPFFSQTYLYFELLDPFLTAPSKKLDLLIEEANKNLSENSNLQNRITLALAHLRNRSNDNALLALGSVRNWRNWQTTRPAWAFISSQVFRLNHDSEKAMILFKGIDFASFDRAEKESLAQLFPQNFPVTQ
jgi:hypothetical protein